MTDNNAELMAEPVGKENQSVRRHFQQRDRITRVLHLERNPHSMLVKALQEVLDILEADRAWLLYSCDPEETVVHVLFEVARNGH